MRPEDLSDPRGADVKFAAAGAGAGVASLPRAERDASRNALRHVAGSAVMTRFRIEVTASHPQYDRRSISRGLREKCAVIDRLHVRALRSDGWKWVSDRPPRVTDSVARTVTVGGGTLEISADTNIHHRGTRLAKSLERGGFPLDKRKP